MTWTRAALALVVAAAVGLALVSGGSSADPATPRALPGLPPPFLGTALAGGGGITAALDAYGDVVDLRPSPAGRALIDNPSSRQAAGTVPADTGIVSQVSVGGGPALAPWDADSVRQRYLPGTNVVRTELGFGRVEERLTTAAVAGTLVVVATAAESAAGSSGAAGGVEEPTGAVDERGAPKFDLNLVDDSGLDCRQVSGDSIAVLICKGAAAGDPISAESGSSALPISATRLIARAAAADRAWLARARPLGPDAPAWARRLYERSLLTLRALTDTRTGAVAAGARDGWAYVWPRDAGTVALAFAAAGYDSEARRAANFLSGLDLGAAARFDAGGQPVPGRAAQGDAAGWAAVAARAAGLPAKAESPAWRNRSDYQEGAPGNYLANAIASTPSVDGPQIQGGQGSEAHQPGVAGWVGGFWDGRGFVQRAGDPGSGLDSAAAWAVRPFAIPALYPAARVTLLALARHQTRFGITPGEAWPGIDPWSAPTAWSAWAFAALAREAASTRRHGRAMQPGRNLPSAAALQAAANRRQALRLFADLRRVATPAGALAERVDARTGVPRSTTPLAWSHAFAVLALRELWPGREAGTKVR